MRDVSDRLQSHLESKHYLHATDLVVQSVTLLHTDLVNVEALRDIRIEMDSKKEELNGLLIDELHKQIYIRSTAPVLANFQREGSQRHSQRMLQRNRQMFQQGNLNKMHSAESKATQLIMAIEGANLDEISKPQLINEDLNRNNDEDPINFIAILIECLARLDKLPEAIETLRSKIKPGLLMIVQKASQQVSDNAFFEDEDLSTNNNPQNLLDLLDLVIRRIKIVAKVHKIILANLKRVENCDSKQSKFVMYDPQEVWLKVQSVLQLFVGDYLDFRNSSSVNGHALSTYDTDTPLDINSYFGKKKNTRSKKFALFRFDHSSHAISINSYLRERRQEDYGPVDSSSTPEAVSNIDDHSSQLFVCKPCTSNITVIYKPLQKFIAEIEVEAQLQPRTCTLYSIITDFIQNHYLIKVQSTIKHNISTATLEENEKGFDAQRIVIDPRKQRELNVLKPLLQSTVTVAKNVADLQALMYDLPDYAEQFINMICIILSDYRDTCYKSYRGIVGCDADEKQIISATWSKDEDIGRFLRCLPNWQSLKGRIEDQVSTSPDDLRALNCKESMILTTNLSSANTVIPQNEVITDLANIKTLANLCESLEWLCESTRDLCDGLSGRVPSSLVAKADQSQSIPALSKDTVKTLSKLANEFEELSELCLLVLHLEVRVHCFYHLIPLAKYSNYCGAIDDMDPDKHVVRMIKDITSLQEIIQHSLQDKKFKYVFEGLAHLVSQILINSTQFLKRINENGIKKMCRNIFSVQQSLTHISTSHERESDMDHARQYYELLYRNPEDILNMIMELGPKFSEQEYNQLFALLNRSSAGKTEEQLYKQLDRLKNILTDFESTA